MKRGELWTVAGGVYAAKPRPALLLQDDVFAATDSVTVAPLTSTLIGAGVPRVGAVSPQRRRAQVASAR